MDMMLMMIVITNWDERKNCMSEQLVMAGREFNSAHLF